MEDVSVEEAGYIEIHEATGKVIQSMRVYDDPPYRREVLVVFTDGTELSVDLEVKIKGDIKHYHSTSGEVEVLSEHKEI